MVMTSLQANQKLDTLSFDFNETSDMAFILDGEAEKALKKIPMKNLIMKRVMVNASQV